MLMYIRPHHGNAVQYAVWNVVSKHCLWMINIWVLEFVSCLVSGVCMCVRVCRLLTAPETLTYSFDWHFDSQAFVSITVWSKDKVKWQFFGSGTQRSAAQHAGLPHRLWACRCKWARWTCWLEMGTGWQELQCWVRNRIYRMPIDCDIHNTEQSFDLDKMIPVGFSGIVPFPDRVKAGFYFSDRTN